MVSIYMVFVGKDLTFLLTVPLFLHGGVVFLWVKCGERSLLEGNTPPNNTLGLIHILWMDENRSRHLEST